VLVTSSAGGPNRGRPVRRTPRPADSPGTRRGASGGPKRASDGGAPAARSGGNRFGGPRAGSAGTGARPASSDRPYRDRDQDGRGGRSSRGGDDRPRRDDRPVYGDRARRDDRGSSTRSSDDRHRRDDRGAPRSSSDRPRRDDRGASSAGGRPRTGGRDDRQGDRPYRGSDARGRSDSRGGERGSGYAGRSPRTTPDGQEFKTRQRATRNEAKVAEPPIPDGLDMTMLERSVRAELRTLSKVNAETVAGHLVAAGLALDTDPQRALAHARAARGRASRIAAVREAVGVAAYHAEEWAEAITELRTARRISGDPRNLPLLADCERALGRPTQAVRFMSDPDVGRLDPEARAELFIVVAGARRDLGQLDAALSVLARGGLDRERPRAGAVRLWYVYADILAEQGRTEDAASWFAAAAALDVEGQTDAAERAADLL